MFHIVICSAGRVETLGRNTLRVIQETQMSVLIVVPHDEVETYREAYPEMNIVGAPRGLVKQRAYARTLYDTSARILFIDDDISRLKRLSMGQLVTIDDCFDGIVETLFDTMVLKGCVMFGVYPVTNRGWMKNTMTVDRAYIVGAFYGIINSIPEEVGEDEAEDFRRQLRLLDSGGHCVRFNHTGITTRYWKGDTGGIQRHEESSRAIFQGLAERYPKYVRVIQNRKGRPNLRFIRDTTEESTP